MGKSILCNWLKKYANFTNFRQQLDTFEVFRKTKLGIFHLCLWTSDGSWSKLFDPGWVGSIFCGSGWVGSGQPFLVWVWIWKMFPKNVKFYNFFTFRSKKISSGRVKKYPVKGRSASYLLRVKSKFGLGQCPPLYVDHPFSTFFGNHSNCWHYLFFIWKLGKTIFWLEITKQLFVISASVRMFSIFK